MAPDTCQYPTSARELSCIWWIDTFQLRHGHYYRYRISGRNDLNNGEAIYWAIPDLRGGGGRYAFALRKVE